MQACTQPENTRELADFADNNSWELMAREYERRIAQQQEYGQNMATTAFLSYSIGDPALSMITQGVESLPGGDHEAEPLGTETEKILKNFGDQFTLYVNHDYDPLDKAA